MCVCLHKRSTEIAFHRPTSRLHGAIVCVNHIPTVYHLQRPMPYHALSTQLLVTCNWVCDYDLYAKWLQRLAIVLVSVGWPSCGCNTPLADDNKPICMLYNELILLPGCKAIVMEFCGTSYPL